MGGLFVVYVLSVCYDYYQPGAGVHILSEVFVRLALDQGGESRLSLESFTNSQL